MINKSTYIFGGGDSDGLLGIATILKKVNDAFFSFTSPRTLHSLIHDLVKGTNGSVYIVDLAIDASTYKDLFKEIEGRPGFDSYFFDQHNLPAGVSKEDLPFTDLSIDSAVSSCENTYVTIGSDLDPIIPAMASLNDGISDTEKIREAQKIHGEKLYSNAKILKFGLAYNIKDNKFKRQLVYDFKEGKYPESIPELVDRYKKGLIRWEEIKKMANERKKSLTHLAYGLFPNLKGGFTNLLAAYLAESTEKLVGVSILETDRTLQKMNIISNDPSLNIGLFVHKVANKFNGFGGGSISSAGATLQKKETTNFLQNLNKEIGDYKKLLKSNQD